MREALTFDDVLLVPKYSEVSSRRLVSTETKFSKNLKLAIPIVSAAMESVTSGEMALAMAKLGGIGIVHRFCTIEDEVTQVFYAKRKGLVAAAVGANGDYFERAQELVKAGVSALVVDVAHAHSYLSIEAIRRLKASFSVDIIGGTVATYEGAIDLIRSGVDGIRVGVGPGSICSTRLVTGFGVPQLTAIQECYRAIQYTQSPVSLIADGGINKSGDIVKAIAAGADCVILGKLLAGTNESAAKVAHGGGKIYRGMASAEAMHHKSVALAESPKLVAPEGVSSVIKEVGPVYTVINNLVWGIRSGFSYAGALNIQQFRSNAEFIRVTPAGLRESHTI